MVKAIARAFRWRDMLENGKYATIGEIAAAEKINETYVGRVLRLTLLAPDIVEAILNGRQPAALQLDGLMRRFPVEWGEQRARRAPAPRRTLQASVMGAATALSLSSRTLERTSARPLRAGDADPQRSRPNDDEDGLPSGHRKSRPTNER